MSTTTESSSLAKCPTLKGKDNYTEWEEVMKSNLITSGCWNITSGDVAAPSKPKPFYTSFDKPSGPATLRLAESEYARQDDDGTHVYSDKACMLRVNEIKEQVAGYESYIKLREKAKNLIMDSVTEDIWFHCTNKDDPKALWDELKKDYKKAGVPELGKELAKFMEMNRSNYTSPQALLNALKTQHAKIETTLKGEMFTPKYLAWRYIYEMNKYKPLFDIPLAAYEGLDKYPAADDVKRALEAHLVNHPDIPKKPTAEPPSAPSQPPASANTTTAGNGNNNNGSKNNKNKNKRKRDEKGKENKDKKDKRSNNNKSSDNKSDNRSDVPICSNCGRRHPGPCWFQNMDTLPQEVRDKLQKMRQSKGH
jgi:hypothetical protein